MEFVKNLTTSKRVCYRCNHKISVFSTFNIYETVNGIRYYLCHDCLDIVGELFIKANEEGKYVRKK